jgi:hypothetical protein
MSISERRANNFFNQVGKGNIGIIRDGRRILKVRRSGFGGGFAVTYSDGDRMELLYTKHVVIEVVSKHINVEYGDNETLTVSFVIESK